MPFAQTVEMVKRVRQDMPALRLKEISYHLGRASNVPDDFAHMARELIGWCARLRDETGWTPPHVDIGGGWAWGRPEGTGPGGADGAATPSYEDFAAAACGAITDECKKHRLAPPGLRIEPGRAISASIGITLGRVGAVKEWPAFGKTWVNVDCSTNHLIRIPRAIWYHHRGAPNTAAEPATKGATTVVGPLCSLDHLGDDRSLPPLQRGDLIAILDTGSYGESTAANYNAEPRPATVMVWGEDADVTTVRESRANVIGRYQVPPRLLAGSFAGARGVAGHRRPLTPP
jgi:diaminopimelate decarboxylase